MFCIRLQYINNYQHQRKEERLITNLKNLKSTTDKYNKVHNHQNIEKKD